MSLRKHWSLLLFFLLIFVLFFLRGAVVPDPDFGWHIRAGQETLRHGIQYTDQFSYAMPSYAFVDHEWLIDLLWAKTYSQWGMFPLLFSTTLLAVASLLFQAILVKKKFIYLLLFLAAGTLFEFVGVRAQIISWFFLSFLVCVLFDQRLWLRWRFLLPLLFLLWANLHGGFGIGLGVLGIVLIGRGLEERKHLLSNMSIFLLCLLATLINPYGIQLWHELWMTFTDTQLRWTVYEWYPAYYFTNFAFWIYFALSLFVVIKYRGKYTRTEIVLYVVLLLEGLGSMRNIPIWVLSSIFLTARGLVLLQKEAAQYKFGKERFIIAYKWFVSIALILFIPQLLLFSYGAFVLKEYQYFYPTAAVAYLRGHKPVQQIFTQYDWGGYLDWQLPEKKVYMDGRMPSWRWHANKPGESNYAFDEYKKVLTGQIPFATFVEKYHITTILIPADQLTQPAIKIAGITIPQNSFWSKFFIPQFNLYDFSKEAQQQGWRVVYRDNHAVILEKPGTLHQNNGS